MTLIVYTLQGRLFEDQNGNGQQEEDEAGIADATIYLKEESRTRRQEWTTTTDEDGFYIFADIPGGSYQIGFEMPPSYGVPGIQWSHVALNQGAGLVTLPLPVAEVRSSIYLPMMQR